MCRNFGISFGHGTHFISNDFLNLWAGFAVTVKEDATGNSSKSPTLNGENIKNIAKNTLKSMILVAGGLSVLSSWIYIKMSSYTGKIYEIGFIYYIKIIVTISWLFHLLHKYLFVHELSV